MFINLSNHPSENWDPRQIEAAKVYGEIQDLPFPQVSPQDTEEDICRLCGQYMDEISRKASRGSAVMVQGEFTFTYQMVNRLKQEGYVPLAACSERIVTESGQGESYRKVAGYRFVKFREY